MVGFILSDIFGMNSSIYSPLKIYIFDYGFEKRDK